ncbi:A/G-specific DNA-adenine glycosylase [Gracilibacillus ureilyticus]|uniref:Adenine DNA glycosylase n=1 Tax=Gracilibacillus ureilyticus TaxID=531814 RepID=A0A1H9QDG6_9BACI|nr:A/G-specific adenine glycosylase [Gracilibacillus ureilyticus]SER58514.1 A/G-specific DNA-adenine glycosylase [Gracilibacillus ureilyticus]
MKNNQLPVTINIPQFRHDLITWFEQEQRDLPWRENQDPYRVWVSEIMLQQTKVETVIPYFHRFIQSFPTLEALAEADEQQVLKAWEGLGYYSRVRNLQAAVREVVADYNAKVPEDAEQFGNLKGVGPYTQGAVLSIAYGKAEPAVDGNVMRVLSRILLIQEDIAKAKTRKIFEQAVRQLISHENPSAFNQGLMELGALICTPRNPSCLLCPVQVHCKAYSEGIQHSLPVKTKKTKQKDEAYYVLVMEDKDGKYILEQRPNEGLLAQMWQFPMVATKEVSENLLEPYIMERYQINCQSIDQLQPVKHIFSHIKWDLNVIKCRCDKLRVSGPAQQILSLDEIESYPLPVSHQKIYKQLLQ